MKFNFKNILLLVIIILCFVTMATVFNGYGQKAEEVTYGDVITYLDKGQVETLNIGKDYTLDGNE